MTERTPESGATARPVAPNDKTYYHDPGGHKWQARARRINELLAAAGGPKPYAEWEYWELVYDHEEAPMTTDAAQLQAAGFEMPDPASLDDAQLSTQLEALLDELDRMHVNVMGGEIIGERALYELLVGRLLHAERPDVPLGEGAGWTIIVPEDDPLDEEGGFEG